MTLDDLLKNPLTENDKNIIANALPIATEDCPEQTDEQLKQFKPWYEVILLSGIARKEAHQFYENLGFNSETKKAFDMRI